ncbi:hypothetical protein [Flavobacterium daemonense]|uniref:hypothetical protein n=1 Tax=Flavobacterium daemonense TaxID=1393049 RepID=UPI001184D8FD|nr:hypothetical protein [Flavobacterium daemonense]KAF2330598.1 hypothetical protein FND99_14305 [Flavobacterium daemonense]
MKTPIEHTRHTCPVSKDQYFIDSWGNLVCIKSYKGDWGDWDEETSFPCGSPADADESHTESETE